MSTYQPSQEAAILTAVMDDDEDEALRQLDDLHEGELIELRRHASALAKLIERVRWERAKGIRERKEISA